jgi:hypothetical protein
MLTVCGGVTASIVLRRRAEVTVRTVYELSQRRQPPTVADLQQRFGDRLKRRPCPLFAECGYEVSVSNRVVASLGVGPYVELKTSFWTKSGVVLASMTDFTINPRSGHVVVVHVRIDFCDTCDTFAIYPWQSFSLSTNGIVEIGQKSPARSKHVALSLNTDCLTKLCGCETIGDLLPSVWEVNGGGIICMVENDRGFVWR